MRVFLAVLMLAVGLWSYAEGRQVLLRVRAERLLADVQALEVNKTTWADFQRFMTRWGRWGNYEGACKETTCMYRVNLQNTFPAPMYGDIENPPRWPGRRLLDVLGFRPAGAMAYLAVRKNKLLAKNFALGTIPPLGVGRDFLAFSGEGSRLFSEAEDRAIHPNRTMLNSRDFMVLVTPSEDSAEKAKLMRFNFRCLTALLTCRDRAALLPEAFQEFTTDAATIAHLDPMQCAVPFWVRARDGQAVFVADVISAKRVTEYGDGTAAAPYWVISAKLREMLKGKLAISSQAPIPLSLQAATVASPNPSEFPYSRLIVAGRATDAQDLTVFPPVMAGDCEIVNATPENLASAKRGVAEDFSPDLD